MFTAFHFYHRWQKIQTPVCWSESMWPSVHFRQIKGCWRSLHYTLFFTVLSPHLILQDLQVMSTIMHVHALYGFLEDEESMSLFLWNLRITKWKNTVLDLAFKTDIRPVAQNIEKSQELKDNQWILKSILKQSVRKHKKWQLGSGWSVNAVKRLSHLVLSDCGWEMCYNNSKNQNMRKHKDACLTEIWKTDKWTHWLHRFMLPRGSTGME